MRDDENDKVVKRFGQASSGSGPAIIGIGDEGKKL